MYEDLVKALRELAEDDNDEAAQAADAIEDLQKAVYFHKYNSEFWEDKYNSLADEKWIPVAERLPKEQINPNTRDFEYVLCTTIWGDVRPFKYGTPIGHREAHFWNGAGYVDAYITHWQPLPEPPMEE